MRSMRVGRVQDGRGPTDRAPESVPARGRGERWDLRVGPKRVRRGDPRPGDEAVSWATSPQEIAAWLEELAVEYQGASVHAAVDDEDRDLYEELAHLHRTAARYVFSFDVMLERLGGQMDFRQPHLEATDT